MRATVAAALFVVAAHAADAGAQSFFTEVDVTVGHSTEDVQAAGTQVRAFGEGPKKWRLFAEASWADVWGPTSDAFGAAYPYNNKFRLMEAFVERTMTGRRMILGTRLGRYRTPFGIYNRSDHAYTGFLRAPLIRYGGYWALSNNFLETGASVVGGIPQLQAEVSLGMPQDEDIQRRRRGFDRVARLQSTFGALIVGGSYILTQPSEERPFAQGDTEFLGVDARWMRSGIQVRGEWIDGRSFDGTRTYGGYADLIVHQPFMGPVTAVARAEKLDYLAGRRSSFPRRYTTGARVRLASMLVAHVNAIHEPAYDQQRSNTSLDVALTFTARR